MVMHDTKWQERGHTAVDQKYFDAQVGIADTEKEDLLCGLRDLEIVVPDITD